MRVHEKGLQKAGRGRRAMPTIATSGPDRPSAFVTGASRDIGAEISKALARRDWDVALGYRTRSRRASLVAEQLHAMGSMTKLIRGDITDPDDRARLLAEVRAWAPRLDALVLNAAGSTGGYDQCSAVARHASDAQVVLVTALMRELSPGGCVVYVTSHWAHLYGKVRSFPQWYKALAAIKHDSERALRALQPMLAAPRHSIRLVIVSAGVATGTLVGDQALKRHPEFAAEQRALNNVVTAEQIGQRVAEVVVDPALANGHTEVVGAPLHTLAPGLGSDTAAEEPMLS